MADPLESAMSRVRKLINSPWVDKIKLSLVNDEEFSASISTGHGFNLSVSRGCIDSIDDIQKVQNSVPF